MIVAQDLITWRHILLDINLSWWWGSWWTVITPVLNYSALPNFADVSWKFYFCENSQGTSWLPWSLWWTYYPAWIYYSNGSKWLYIETPYQATQDEVNIWTNDNKFLTPLTYTTNLNIRLAELPCFWNVSIKTADYTLTILDFTIWVDDSTWTKNITLPNPNIWLWKIFNICKLNDSNNEVKVLSTEWIDWQTEIIISNQYDNLTVQSFGTFWKII